MLSLSLTTGYAILALSCIGVAEGRWVLSEQIRACSGIPMPYLRKILYELGKAGLIRTKRGYRGGCALARPAEQISLMDVVEAVEGGDGLHSCLLGLPGCSHANPCPSRGFWQKKRAEIEAYLRRTNLAEAAHLMHASNGSSMCCESRNGASAPESEEERGSLGETPSPSAKAFALTNIRILLADDHAILRASVRMLLESQPDMEIVGEAADGREAIDKVRELRPDLVVMDITMPDVNGLEATRQICTECPDVRVLALTMHEDEQYFFQTLQAGASGYMAKGAPPADFISAVRSVAQGQAYFYPSLTRKLLDEYLGREKDGVEDVTHDQLTDREC